MSFAARLKILPQNSEEKPRNLPGLYFFFIVPSAAVRKGRVRQSQPFSPLCLHATRMHAQERHSKLKAGEK